MKDYTHQVFLAFTKEGKFYQREIDVRTKKGRELRSIKLGGKDYPFDIAQSTETRWTPFIERKWYNPWAVALETIARFRFKIGVQIAIEADESSAGVENHIVHISESDFDSLTPAIAKARTLNQLYEKYQKRVRIGSGMSIRMVLILMGLLFLGFIILLYTGTLGG